MNRLLAATGLGGSFAIVLAEDAREVGNILETTLRGDVTDKHISGAILQ